MTAHLMAKSIIKDFKFQHISRSTKQMHESSEDISRMQERPLRRTVNCDFFRSSCQCSDTILFPHSHYASRDLPRTLVLLFLWHFRVTQNSSRQNTSFHIYKRDRYFPYSHILRHHRRQFDVTGSAYPSL